MVVGEDTDHGINLSMVVGEDTNHGINTGSDIISKIRFFNRAWTLAFCGLNDKVIYRWWSVRTPTME